MQLIGEEEDVSVYDIADHPDFRFRTTDIVIRIGNSDGATANEDEVGSECSYVTVASPALSVGACGRSPWETMVWGLRLCVGILHSSLLGLFYCIPCCREKHWICRAGGNSVLK